MTSEDLNIELYEKLRDEQERFRAELMEKTPAWILDGAYEYCIREDIVLCMESLDLSDKQARALLKLKNPLAEISKATLVVMIKPVRLNTSRRYRAMMR